MPNSSSAFSIFITIPPGRFVLFNLTFADFISDTFVYYEFSLLVISVFLQCTSSIFEACFLFLFLAFSLLIFPHSVEKHVNCPIISINLLCISVRSIMLIVSISSHFLLSHSSHLPANLFVLRNIFCTRQ